MKLRSSLVLTAFVLALSTAVALGAPAVSTASHSKGGYAFPVDGTTAAGAPVTGTFEITNFKRIHGVVTAVGTFTGSLNSNQVSAPASAPVTAIDGTSLDGRSPGSAAAAALPAASCSILDLTLAPLHLNVLGLVVDLNQVHLQITGDRGAGNLLGNLLCGVAGLLDNTPTNGLLQQITNLLNQILGAL
jgi:hypothetical protein